LFSCHTSNRSYTANGQMPRGLIDDLDQTASVVSSWRSKSSAFEPRLPCRHGSSTFSTYCELTLCSVLPANFLVSFAAIPCTHATCPCHSGQKKDTQKPLADRRQPIFLDLPCTVASICIQHWEKRTKPTRCLGKPRKRRSGKSCDL